MPSSIWQTFILNLLRQIRVQGKGITIIQDIIVLLRFQGKLSLFRASLARTGNRYKVKAFLMMT